MTPTDLKTLIRSNPEISRHADYFLGLVKPSVRIQIAKEGPQRGSSKFGGEPEVPQHFEWPQHAIGDYVFIGQVNFSEIVNAPADLPRAGMLALFYALDDEGEVFWGDDGYVLGYYFEQTAELKIQKAPHRHVKKQKKIILIGSADIPRHEELRTDWPLPFEQLESRLFEKAQLPDDYLLGYPSFCSLAYDPTPSSEWCSLLTLQSHEQFDWCWHDGDKLMIFIEKSKLANRDFSNLKADAG